MLSTIGCKLLIFVYYSFTSVTSKVIPDRTNLATLVKCQGFHIKTVPKKLSVLENDDFTSSEST